MVVGELICPVERGKSQHRVLESKLRKQRKSGEGMGTRNREALGRKSSFQPAQIGTQNGERKKKKAREVLMQL